jgi:fructokinase
LRQPTTAAALDDLLQRHSPPVFMDVNLRSPWWSADCITPLLDRAEWVKVSDAELGILVEEPGTLERRATLLMERHDLSWLIVTRGKQGALSLDRAGHLLETRPPAKLRVVDTVGAGDAFASVCILGLLREWHYRTIIDRAQRFAAMLVQSRGATLRDQETYDALLEEWR